MIMSSVNYGERGLVACWADRASWVMLVVARCVHTETQTSKESPVPFKSIIASLALAASVAVQTPAFAADSEALTNAKARVEAATKVYEDSLKRMESDPGRYPLDFDKLCTWSARRMDAQRDAAVDGDAKARAVQDHLARVKDVGKLARDLAKKGITVGYDIAITDYYRLEAERLAAGEKKK
jgi:hypothetical protein